MTNFNWQNYLENYPDLVLAGIQTKDDAWRHYQKYGKNEKRTDRANFNKNTTNENLGGRLGNVLFYNFVASYLSKLNGLKMYYKQQTETENILKIKLFDTGKNFFKESFLLTDKNIDSVFENTEMIKDKNLITLRPENRLRAKHWDFILGKKVKKNLKKGDSLDWSVI
jgi:hypothetical protein